MSEATPKRFEPKEGEGPLALADVLLHRVFETDRAGRSWVHLWVTAEATPQDETFQSITADVIFVLRHGGDELGVCASRAVQFEKREPIAIKADDGLRIDANADVTAIGVRIDLVKVVHETAEQSYAPT